MNRDELEERVLKILASKTRAGSVEPATRLGDLELESIDVIEVAFDIEEAIDCELNLTPDDFGLATGESRTVAWLVDSVEEQIRTARG